MNKSDVRTIRKGVLIEKGALTEVVRYLIFQCVYFLPLYFGKANVDDSLFDLSVSLAPHVTPSIARVISKAKRARLYRCF